VTLSFRAARLEDADLLGEQSIRAYPTPGATAAQRAERYRSGRMSAIETVTIAERDGEMVGSMRTIPFTGWIGGVPTPVGGLAGVAVSPEARQTGVAAALVRRHLEELRAARTSWSFLYPFAPRFYAKHGWAPAARRLRWRLAPSALPRSPDAARARRLRLDDPSDRDAIHRAYERHCVRTNGSLSRTVEQLVRFHEGAFVVGVPGASGLAGYLIYTIRSPTPRPQTLVVHEWVAEDGATERVLLGFLAAQRDQVEALTLDTAPDYPLAALLDNGTPAVEDDSLPEEHHALAALASGLMARIVDLGGAVAARGYPGQRRGAVALAVTRDALVPENVGTVTALVEGGVAQVMTGRAAGAPLVAGPVGPLSAILVGGVRLDESARLGLVAVEGDVAAASALLALPPPAPLVAF